MKCYIFSIGERTTQLCCDLMREYGFEVILFQDSTSLWEKLKRFYTEALESGDDKFMRIDADIIPNRNVLRLAQDSNGWNCASGFDWYKQDRGAISVHVMSRSVIEECLWNIDSARDKVRPETHLWRLHNVNPRTQVMTQFSCGIHGYGQSDQRERIKSLKLSRNQDYDWNLVEKIEAL